MDCAKKFEKNIRTISTVEDVQLNFGASKVTVQGDISIEKIEEAGAFDGITVEEKQKEGTGSKVPFWKKRANIEVMTSVLFIIIGYIFYFQQGEYNPLIIGTFAFAILIGGYDLFISGFRNLAKLEFDMKTLMTIAIIGAAIIGEWAEGAVVIVLFALSEALEDYSLDKSRQSIRTLMDIAPKIALIRRGSEEVTIDVEDIQVNDILLVKPGEKIAMDGGVIVGESSINQAAITGESIPTHKVVGDDVFAGTMNGEGFLEVRVTKHVEDTTIAKIIHLVEEAQAERAPSQKFVDQFAKYYTPAIMVIALLVAIGPSLFFEGVWSDWIYSGLAVLVVGCPCALVISTPVAIVTAIGNAARNGVLIKGGIHLEELGKIKVVAFDKTGTLTEGQPTVTDVTSTSDLTQQDILGMAAAVESFSQHPLAAAIIRKATDEKAKQYVASNFQSITGKGAKAVIGGVEYYIGNPKLFTEMNNIPKHILNDIKSLQSNGKTVMLLGTETSIFGFIAVADQVRNSSRSIVQKLYDLGIKKTIMLTGDNKATGDAIGKQLRITEAYAELLPEDKLQVIESLETENNHVAMIGDGINDAPALATASVGIAMGGAGTDTAIETADIALMADDLDKLPYTMGLSRKVLSVIKQNISFALGLKIIALLLVIPGWLTLWIAIFADVGATLIVVLNSMRLARTKI